MTVNFIEIASSSGDEPASGMVEELHKSPRNSSRFGQLIATCRRKERCAALQDGPNSPKLSDGPLAADLEELHLGAFIAWISLPLRHQKYDIDLWLEDRNDKLAVIGQLREIGQALLPTGVREDERMLFLTDLATLEIVLGHEFGQVGGAEVVRPSGSTVRPRGWALSLGTTHCAPA